MMRLSAFGLVVRDMRATVRFYSALGVRFPDGAAEQPHVEVQLDGGLRLLFDTIEVVQRFSEWTPPTGGHRMGLAFECDDPADVDARFAALVRDGVQPLNQPFDAFWGQRYAQVLDPDGNPVDLFAAQQG